MSVRPFVEQDIPQAADLFWNFMREREGQSPAEIRACFRNLYFASPWVDSAFPSFVYEAKNGKIVGFLGVITRKMAVGGQTIRLVYGGNFVVHPEGRANLAGMRLLGAYMARGADILLTDSANDTSRTLLEKLGFTTIAPLSMHWVRPLRLGHFGVDAISRMAGPKTSAALKFTAEPVCAVVDSVAARLSLSPFRRNEARLHAAELDVETLLHCLAEFRGTYSLLPEYDVNSIGWLLSYMNRMPARGNLRKFVLRDDEQKIVGWYIYYAKPGGIGEVVQIGGDPAFTKDVLDHLFSDAWQAGAIALHGVLELQRMPYFSEKNCVFTCRGGWTVAYSRKPELLELLNRGDAMLSRLDGEWCLDPGRSVV